MKNKTAILFATWFGAGFIPPIFLKEMNRVYNSIITVPLIYIALRLTETTFSLTYLIIILVIYILGSWSVPLAEEALGVRIDRKGKVTTQDQSQIVIDEVLGMLISCSLLQINNPLFYWLILIGFCLFHFFHFIKISPINCLSRMEVDSGVMLGGIIAGLYTLLSLEVIRSVFLILT